ncbi:hypothetical protein CRE_30352, partial [Caenorhabditis remanei]
RGAPRGTDPAVVRDHGAHRRDHLNRARHRHPARIRGRARRAEDRRSLHGRHLVELPRGARPGQLPRPRGSRRHRRPGDRRARPRPQLQRAAGDHRLGRDRHRRAQDRREGRAVHPRRRVRARDHPEGAVVDHPPRSDRHARPHRQRGRRVRLEHHGVAHLVRRDHLHRSRARAVRRLPDPREDPRPLDQAVLLGRLARGAARVREPLLDRHPAADRARDRTQPGRAPRLRLVRGAARRDHQDGRLRRDLPGRRLDLHRAVLRPRALVHAVPADRARLGGRLGGDRGHHRRHGHADAHPLDARPAARGRRPAARGRPDPRYGPHRGERRRPGARARDRGAARGDPRPRPLQRAAERPRVRQRRSRTRIAARNSLRDSAQA